MLDKIRKICIHLEKISEFKKVTFVRRNFFNFRESMYKESKNVTIFVDADACPVAIRRLLQSISAKNRQISVCFVASYKHQFNDLHENVYHVIVDAHREAADLYIANHVRKRNIVITQDIGLASIALAKNAYVISHTGKMYSNDTIDEKLFFRHLGSKLRRAGQKTKGPKKYSLHDFRQFKITLNKILSKEGLS